MRIVHLYDGHEMVYQGKGSVPDVVWNNARYAAAAGHDVIVIERQWHGTSVIEEHDNVTFWRIPIHIGSSEPWQDIPAEMVTRPLGIVRLSFDRIEFAMVALRLLRSMTFDVVHVHLPFAANVLATIAPSLSNRMVYTAHLGETIGRVVEPLVSPDAYLANRAARTIVLNPTTGQAFAERGVPESKLRVIPNGVDITRFRGNDAEALRTLRCRYELEDTQVVLFVGTVTPRKGVRELVRAVSKIVSDGTDDFIVVITGRTDLRPGYVEKVKGEIADTGIEEWISFTGFVPESDLQSLYTLADLFVLPSHEEGSSIAIAEAIASETPIVGTDIDGIRGPIEHGVHGLLSEPGDVDALATNLVHLLEERAERARMRAAMRDRAQQLSWDHIIDEIETVYWEVMVG